MGFRNGAYAKVWDVKTGNGNFVDLRISISRKDSDGNYVDDFSGFVRCYSDACVSAAKKLSKGDRIKLGDVDVSQRYVKEEQKTYTNFKLFSFENADGNSNSNSGGNKSTNTSAKKASKPKVVEPEEDDDLPF